MTNFNVIENKVSSAKKYLNILEEYQHYTKEKIEQDITIKGAVERYLCLAIQATIDLSEAVISYKDFRKPTTLSESFVILGERKIIPNKLMTNMIKMVGFRNVVIYDYEEIDYDIVYDVLQNRLVDIVEFIDIVTKRMK